ncbi:hypothetical protein AMELA_G00089400 [Ameiurus melas]|uniref:Uncharacterized protein n=1 Tax=Ameiurus melas TaxID=219545 RepID=A0A7J6AY62_AMEME|nr:hypothetical protein AMELA_G00089400 [Ameiurus melas]
MCRCCALRFRSRNPIGQVFCGSGAHLRNTEHEVGTHPGWEMETSGELSKCRPVTDLQSKNMHAILPSTVPG